MHVVGPLRRFRQQGGQIDVGQGRAGYLIVVAVLAAEQQGELARPGQGLAVGRRHHVDDPGAPAVRIRPAEPLHVHVLAGHAAHDIRSGHEDAALVGQDHQVGQGRPVGGTAGRGPEHDRDLRHLARGTGHGREDEADRVQALDALAQPRAAGMPEPDHRGADLQRPVVGGDDHDTAGAAHRAALHPRVTGERHGRHVVDQALGGEHAAGVGGQQQPHGSGVEESLEPGQRVAPGFGRAAVPRGAGTGRARRWPDWHWPRPAGRPRRR